MRSQDLKYILMLLKIFNFFTFISNYDRITFNAVVELIKQQKPFLFKWIFDLIFYYFGLSLCLLLSLYFLTFHLTEKLSW